MSQDIPIKDVATTFLRLVVSGQVQEAFDRCVGHGFLHHNPFFRGDALSLRTAMQEDAQANPDKTLDVQHALQEGNIVIVHSRLCLHAQTQEMAVVHVFRFDGNRIVELWDVGQFQPEHMANEHGMF